MTAALVVIAVVALVAIVALVVMARRAGAMLDKERARADGLEAQVQALEATAADSDASSTPAEPAVGTAPREPATAVATGEPAANGEPEPAATAEPEPAATVPAEEPTATPEPEPVVAGSEPAEPEPAAVRDEPAVTAPVTAAPEPADSFPAGEPTTAGPEPVAAAPADQPAAAADAVSPAERVTANSHGGVAAEPLLELERLRLEREWADIVGTATPLPVPWDGSVRGVVAVELDIIREVIGTPSRIEPAATSAAEPAVAVATARLATEILRRLAKAGEEILVTFESDTDVTMAIAVEGNEVKPDLSDLITTAAELGGHLTLLETEEGFEAQLRVPARPA
jgi:hypothetical protein